MPSTETFTSRVPMKIPRAIQNQGGVRTATISANETWTHQSSTYQILNGGGSDRNLTLPAEESSDGIRYVVRNSGTTNNLVIKNDAAATIATLAPGEWTEVVCESSSWVLGAAGSAGADDFGVGGIKTDAITESTAGAGVDITGTGAMTLESSGGAISIGANAVAQAVNIATGNAARAITIGHTASASLTMHAGAGALTADATGAVDIDGGGAVSLNSAGAAINIGDDAVAQPVNIGTGAAARVITVGNAASASLTLEAGVGALVANADTTATINAGTSATLNAPTVIIPDGAALALRGAGTGTGDVVEQVGATSTEAFRLVVYDQTVNPAAVETNLLNLPAGSVLVSVQAVCTAALTGGGTTVTWSIGTAGDPDHYGSAGYNDIDGSAAADSLAQNSKVTWFGNSAHAWAISSAAEQLVLTGAATGGAADGDTALTVGSVRVRVIYWQLQALDSV